MIVASILLAFTWVVSANNGTSQKAVACSFSYSGLGNWLIIIIIIIIIITIIIIIIIILFSAYFPLYKNNFSWCSLL